MRVAGPLIGFAMRAHNALQISSSVLDVMTIAAALNGDHHRGVFGRNLKGEFLRPFHFSKKQSSREERIRKHLKLFKLKSSKLSLAAKLAAVYSTCV